MSSLEPAILVIFGITGDLSQRYLMPALYNLTAEQQFHPKTRIIGITRGDTTVGELYQKASKSIEEANNGCDESILDAMRQQTEMFKMDLDDPQGYANLLLRLNALEDEIGMCLNRLYYLSIPPKAYPSVIKLLGQGGLNKSCQHDKASTRLMVEKPFGSDLASAQNLLAETANYFTEDQTFRIDHYMAKQAAQDIMASRLDDKDREATWDKDHITAIQIIAKEKIGIEGRAVFYEPLGALRDFIQSHLIQILGIVTMDMPGQLNSESIHAQKEAVLNEVVAVPADKAGQRAIRGQYHGYREEVQNPGSTTETYASVTVYINNDRWQEVPITMLTGKALDEKRTEVSVSFKDGSKTVFDLKSPEGAPSNAYEKVFSDAIKGDHSLFASSPEILSSWRILQPVLDSWSQTSDDLIIYEPGSAGPAQTSV
jgi:glucose-6-phosphate 1-dehydrogenase